MLSICSFYDVFTAASKLTYFKLLGSSLYRFRCQGLLKLPAPLTKYSTEEFSGFICYKKRKRKHTFSKYEQVTRKHFEFDVVTSQRQTQSKMAAPLVVNILVFDLRVQLQHGTYQRKTLLFALIKVSTFICKREISGLSSPFNFGAPSG